MLPPRALRLGSAVRQVVPGVEGVEIITHTPWSLRSRRVHGPVDVVLGMLSEVPEPVRASVALLQFNPLAAVTLGLEGVDPHGFTAVYFPDPTFLSTGLAPPASSHLTTGLRALHDPGGDHRSDRRHEPRDLRC